MSFLSRRYRPDYPVVDPAPTLYNITANFDAGDYAVWTGMTSFGVWLGAMQSLNGKPIRSYAVVTLPLTGCILGYMRAVNSSRDRLTGHSNNWHEVRYYGKPPPPPLFPVVDPAPTLAKVTANFDLGDYAAWISMTGWGIALMPLGDWGGELRGKPIRGSSRAAFALTGCTLGFMYAASSSRQRLTGYSFNDREVEIYGIHKPLEGPGPVTAFSLAQEKGRLAKMWGGRKE